MKSSNHKKGQAIIVSLFAALILFAGYSYGVSPTAPDSGVQEIVLKVENMT